MKNDKTGSALSAIKNGVLTVLAAGVLAIGSSGCSASKDCAAYPKKQPQNNTGAVRCPKF